MVPKNTGAIGKVIPATSTAVIAVRTVPSLAERCWLLSRSGIFCMTYYRASFLVTFGVTDFFSGTKVWQP